jgi:hypothetical protein
VAARVRARVWSSGVCGGHTGTGAGFLQIFILPNSPFSQSPEAGTTGQKWPTCRVDPVWTPHPNMRIKKNTGYNDRLNYRRELLHCVHRSTTNTGCPGGMCQNSGGCPLC